MEQSATLWSVETQPALANEAADLDGGKAFRGGEQEDCENRGEAKRTGRTGQQGLGCGAHSAGRGWFAVPLLRPS
ncbi:hypothetical protein AAFF_G00215780 [Aldrovandia affinis]|uniref:Uncharacterized protein n=1 Tax=Aldrovandia affinis TaxID=143900 RepID=A0AAD7RJ49_9TELE|nr:hypothetical protein AAFF_G00215780 [Aldrovandia affinis]